MALVFLYFTSPSYSWSGSPLFHQSPVVRFASMSNFAWPSRFLFLKRHALGKLGPWRRLQPLRKVGDTRGIEGVFSETRVGMICATGTAAKC